MGSWLFLFVILIVGFLGKNNALVIATLITMLLKILPATQGIMEEINKKGINWGVILITVAVLIPIATSKIGFNDLILAFSKPAGWIAVFCGVLVAILSRNGVNLLHASPQVTVALVIGTIMGVVFLDGIAAGPVIAAGLTYFLLTIFHIGF